MKRLAIAAIVAVALAGGVVTLIPQAEAKEAVSCSWTIQQYSRAQANYWGCVQNVGSQTPPNDSSHPCWSQFQTMWYFNRLVQTSCQIHQQ